MCTYSVIADDWTKRVPDRYPDFTPWVNPHPYQPLPSIDSVPRAEFERLKAELEELKKLIAAAQKFDKATNQCGCEQEEKIGLIKKLCELVGVEFPTSQSEGGM